MTQSNEEVSPNEPSTNHNSQPQDLHEMSGFLHRVEGGAVISPWLQVANQRNFANKKNAGLNKPKKTQLKNPSTIQMQVLVMSYVDSSSLMRTKFIYKKNTVINNIIKTEIIIRSTLHSTPPPDFLTPNFELLCILCLIKHIKRCNK